MEIWAVVSIILFFGAIIAAFLLKNNIGVFAMTVGVIAVHLFGLTESDLINGISVTLFTTLTGITLLFSIITKTGALELLAKKIVSLAGKRIWLLPILIAAAGWFLVFIGPGGVPVLAIIPPLAVSIALQVGYNPLMMACIGITGMLSARFSPLTPEGNIILNAIEEAGYTGSHVNLAIIVNTGITSIIICVVLFFMFGGHKVKAPENLDQMKVTEKFTPKQLIALAGIIALLVLIIGLDVNIGLSAFIVSAVLLIFRVADDGECIKAMPWNTIMMVLCVGALLGIVDAAGGIDLLTNALSNIMTAKTAAPLMGLMASLMSLVSSALSVVYPTLMPVSIGIADQISGVHAVALMSAVGVGGAIAGTSPMSTGGALIMGALGNEMGEDYTKEYQNKTFVNLLIVCVVSVVITVVTAAIFYVPIANLIVG